MENTLTVPSLNIAHGGCKSDQGPSQILPSNSSKPSSNMLSNIISTLKPSSSASKTEPTQTKESTINPSNGSPAPVEPELRAPDYAMDSLSAVLASKSCFAFVLNTTLHAYERATSAAEAAVRLHVATKKNLSTIDVHRAWVSGNCTALSRPDASDNTAALWPLSWREHQAKVFEELLSRCGSAAADVNTHDSDNDLNELFRVYKKTLYAQLSPSTGLLPLMRALHKRNSRILVLFDPASTTREQAEWTIEHLLLSNFVDGIAFLPSNTDTTRRDSGTNVEASESLAFPDVLARLAVPAEAVVLFAGGDNNDADKERKAAAREGVASVLLDSDSGVPAYEREDGGFAVNALPVVREAVRRTSPPRDGTPMSEDSARI